jgi:hypothetical protein
MPSKKKFISKHNSLVKLRSNLHQESWEKQNYIYVLQPLENLHQESFSILYFFFHPPTYRGTPTVTTIRARIYARGRWVLPNLYFLPSWFTKVLDAQLVCQTIGVALWYETDDIYLLLTSTYYCKIHCTDLECCVSVLGQDMYLHLHYIQAVEKML